MPSPSERDKIKTETETLTADGRSGFLGVVEQLRSATTVKGEPTVHQVKSQSQESDT